MPSLSRSCRRRALSLPELLVALLLVALLAVLLQTSVQRLRESANAAICVGHLRLIGAAFFQYANDYEGYINPARQTMPNYWNGNLSGRPWNERLVRYGRYSPNDYGLTPQHFLCPSEKRTFQYHHYAANPHITGMEPIAGPLAPPQDWIYPLRRFVNLRAERSRVILVTENDRLNDMSASTTAFTAFRHRGRSNVLYADGHVEAKVNAQGNPSLSDGITGADYVVGK